MDGKENSKADDESEAWRCTHRAILLNALGVWMKSSMEDRGRNERANKRMLAVMYRHLDLGESLIVPDESLNETEKSEYNVMSSYIRLASMLISIRQCEYYFRRFPFTGLPISRSEYLRNCCEMVFDRIMQLRDNLKIVLNAIKTLEPDTKIPIGSIVKAFNRSFNQIQRLRNQTHHVERFNDDIISQLSMLEIFDVAHRLNIGGKKNADSTAIISETLNSKKLYRQACRKWVGYVHDYEKVAERYVELVAEIILVECVFIKPHISQADLARLPQAKKRMAVNS
jgi:hypothetical protein